MRAWKAVFRALADESGQGMVEYGIIIALVAVLVIGGLLLLKGGLASVFGRITDCLNNATNGNGC